MSFTAPFAFSVPVRVFPCSWEGEVSPDEHIVCLKTTKTRSRPRTKIGFVLKDSDIHDGHINVNVLKRNKKSALVEPVAEYVPFIWGLVGIPPRQFRVPLDTIHHA